MEDLSHLYESCQPTPWKALWNFPSVSKLELALVLKEFSTLLELLLGFLAVWAKSTSMWCQGKFLKQEAVTNLEVWCEPKLLRRSIWTGWSSTGETKESVRLKVLVVMIQKNMGGDLPFSLLLPQIHTPSPLPWVAGVLVSPHIPPSPSSSQTSTLSFKLLTSLILNFPQEAVRLLYQWTSRAGKVPLFEFCPILDGAFPMGVRVPCFTWEGVFQVFQVFEKIWVCL